MNIEVYDLECLRNLFTYTGYNLADKKYYQYVICPWRNDYVEMMSHLSKLDYQVGFNNLAYDGPLLMHMIRYRELMRDYSGEMISSDAYKKSQELIDMEFSDMSNSKAYIKQIDLFKIHGFDNASRRTSLKDLEINMRMDNVQDMPIHHTRTCKKGDEYIVLDYNKNDVEATVKLWNITIGNTDNPIYKGENMIKIRKDISKQFGVDVLNLPDIRMGERLLLKLYSEHTNQEEWTLKKNGGTNRSCINLSDCIPAWANFTFPEFKNIKQSFLNKTVYPDNMKNSLDMSVVINGYKMVYGLGGVHASADAGVYKSDDEWVICDQDISSLYPSMICSLKLKPAHLQDTFITDYNNFRLTRIAEKRKDKSLRNNGLIRGYKYLLNAVYGKTNESKSWLYDPFMTLSTTIGGQMYITLWTEMLMSRIKDIRMLQTNTDGLTFLIKRSDLHIAQDIVKELNEITGLETETVFYKRMILKDVNNYIAEYEDSTIEKPHLKLKGCFEIDKELHKDTSARIIPIALKEFFINNVPVAQTIRNHKNIYDFCLRLRTNSDSNAYFDRVDDGRVVTDKLTKTTRYYISKGNVGVLYKMSGKKRTMINVGVSSTIFNKFEDKPFDEYNVDYNFYIGEARKIQLAIDDGQLSLF